MRLYSPNKRGSVIPHPAQVENMVRAGWLKTKPKKNFNNKSEV